jgi:hypothetical protein
VVRWLNHEVERLPVSAGMHSDLARMGGLRMAIKARRSDPTVLAFTRRRQAFVDLQKAFSRMQEWVRRQEEASLRPASWREYIRLSKEFSVALSKYHRTF